jgi:hypothetical protein
MTRPIQSTITALVVAASFIAASALISEPLPPAQETVPVAISEQSDTEVVGQAEGHATEQLARLKARVGLSMPYYSFGSLLPRTRGS